METAPQVQLAVRLITTPSITILTRRSGGGNVASGQKRPFGIAETSTTDSAPIADVETAHPVDPEVAVHSYEWLGCT